MVYYIFRVSAQVICFLWFVGLSLGRSFIWLGRCEGLPVWAVSEAVVSYLPAVLAGAV